jgi:hypothetical protein
MKIEYDDMCNIERTDTGIKVSNFDKIGRYSLKYYLGYDHLDKYAIYKSDDGQDLLIRGNLDRLLGDDEINIFGCDLYLSKLDKDTNEKLAGSIYGIYDSNHELIKEVPISDKESTYINDLPIGTYYLQELVSPDGYLLDDTIYTIAFDDDNSYYNILLFDEKINNSINEEITMDETLLNDVEEALEIKLSKFILNSVFEITNDNTDIKELSITIKNLINAMLNKYNIDKENKYTMELVEVSYYTKDNENNIAELKEDIDVDVLYDINILVKSR